MKNKTYMKNQIAHTNTHHATHTKNAHWQDADYVDSAAVGHLHQPPDHV